MKRLQQYYIIKVSTSRLKRSNYNLQLNIEEARKGGEIVSIGDSQMLRSLRRIKNTDIDEEYIKELFLQKTKIKRKKYSKENSQKLLDLEKKIDDLLFVPEIISVFVKDIRHYEYIGKNGFILNGIKYNRFICGAGQARRNNVLFVSENVEKKLKAILNNNRKENIEISPAKYSAYFSLASSATLSVSEPYFCVVPDYEVKRNEKVDFIVETESGKDDIVEEREMEIPFNLWDGQGLISVRMAEKWAQDLELDYIPSAFIIRANFIKGMVCTVDFHDFAENVALNHYIKDIWGNKVNIRDMDIILTQSQFKLWDAYDSIDDYVRKCRQNDLNWGITRVTPKKEDDYTFLNYQFIQALKLDDNQIKSLCQKTINYFEGITKNKIDYSLLYLLGEISHGENPDNNIFEKINDNVTKALILNNQLLNDQYVKNYLLHSLNKRIKESYIGNLVIDGHYTMMVADPIAFLEYIFNLPIKGLLNRNEHYNHYWLKRKTKTIVGMRAPLTWRSEVNILNLKQNDDINYWYRYLNNCVVYNVFGNDCLIHGGSDYDGDIVCVTNNQEIIDGAYRDLLPIYYESKKVPKQKIIDEELYKSDINGFNNKVGFVTNVATTAFSMLPNFDENSLEYKEIIDRLKRFRKEQGSTIDATKGLVIKPFPMHWTKRIKEDKENYEFLNKIVINKRPYFMRWLYSSYNRNYIKYNDKYNKHFYLTFDDNFFLSESNKNNDDKYKILEKYYSFNPLLNSGCLMNKIAHYLEQEIKELKFNLRQEKPTEQNILILKDKNIKTDRVKLKQLYDLYKKYKNGKKNFRNFEDSDGNRKYKTIEQYNKYIEQEAYKISSSGAELVNLAVDICYVLHLSDNKTFVWQVFGDDVVENIMKNRQDECWIPFENQDGKINFLNNKYSMYKIDIEKIEKDIIYEDF